MSGNNSSLYDLVGLLLEENFGNNDVTKIGKELFSSGAQTISELLKKTRMDYVSIRNALIILVQNKLVSFEEKRRKELPNMSNIQIEEGKEIFYHFMTENCLMRLKFPKILYNIKVLYGEIGQMIFEEFIMFGVMNSNQCVEAVYDKIGTGRKMDLNNIRIAFVKMIESNYLIQCTKIKFKENVYEDKKSLDKDKKKKKGGKKKEEEKMEEDVPTEKPNTSSLINTQVIDEEHILLFNKEKQKPYYFYINFEKIVKDIKIDLMSDLVVQKVSNPIAGLVVTTMLRSSLEVDFNAGKSTGMSVEDILKKIPEKHGLKEKGVNELLARLKSEENNYVYEWGHNDKGHPLLCVNIDIITQMIKTKTVEKIIEQQFSSNHVRIYRLLSKCGPLDLKNISEICLLSQKETASHLNQMIQENYIEFKEFNKLHFYSINLRNNIELFVLKIYKMIFNIKYRLNYEIEKLKHKMEKTIENYITKVYGVISELDETVLIIKDL